MDSFRDLFTTFAIIGVFIFASISFIVTTQIDNSANNTILENDVINRTYERLETNLSDFGSQTQTQRESFESEIPERGYGSLIIFAIVGIGQRFSGIIASVYNIIIVLPASILGVSPVVISTITAIVLVSMILLIWRVYRSGG